MGRKTLFFGLVGLLCLSGAVTAFLTLRENVDKGQVNNANELCNTDEIGTEIKSKYSNFAIEQAAEMDSLIEQIKQVKDYESSVNCLYVLGKYSTYKYEHLQASNYYDKLLALYSINPDVWIDAKISTDSVGLIKSLSDFGKGLEEQNKKNLGERGGFTGMEYNE